MVRFKSNNHKNDFFMIIDNSALDQFQAQYLNGNIPMVSKTWKTFNGAQKAAAKSNKTVVWIKAMAN